jgi:biopolymer transport protein ExbD
MRTPSSYNAGRKPIDLQMTPMIDCVFLLLVYFIWSSSFVAPEYILPGELSAAPAVKGGTGGNEAPPPEADFEDVVVRMRGTAGKITWQVNDSDVPSLEALQTSLARIAQIKKDAPVVLHPEQEVPLGDVIDVYDIARSVGFVKIQFATNGAS